MTIPRADVHNGNNAQKEAKNISFGVMSKLLVL